MAKRAARPSLWTHRDDGHYARAGARSARIRKGVRGKPKICACSVGRRKIAARFVHHWLACRPARRGRCPLQPPLWGSFNRCAVSVAVPADGQGLHPAPARPRAWVPGRSTTTRTARKRSLTRAKALGEKDQGQRPEAAHGLPTRFWARVLVMTKTGSLRGLPLGRTTN